MSMWGIYTAATSAINPGEPAGLDVATFVAPSLEDARAEALRGAGERWPPDAGWTQHRATVMPLSLQFLVDAMEQLKAIKDADEDDNLAM